MWTRNMVSHCPKWYTRINTHALMSVALAIVRVVVLAQYVLEVFVIAPVYRSLPVQLRHASDAPLVMLLGSY